MSRKKLLLLSTIVSYSAMQYSSCNATSLSPDSEEHQAIMTRHHQSYSATDSLDNDPLSGSLDKSPSTSQLHLKASIFRPFIVDYKDINKAFLALAFLPAVEASAEETATSFYGSVLPIVGGGFILSALAAPILKDALYKGYQSFASSRFDKMTEWLDTTIVTRWPHESLRWGYFAIFKGNRGIGDIPILVENKRNLWRSFYEWTTSQPYTVELRHAVKLESFKPYIVKTVKALDKEFEKTGSWERTELRDENSNLFRGFSYQSGGCTLHIRGGSANESFEGMVSLKKSDNVLSSEGRYKTWVKFLKPFKDNDIEILPSNVEALFVGLVLDKQKGKDRIRMISTNFNNTLYFDYRRGLIIALQKNSYPLPDKEEIPDLKKKGKKKQKKVKKDKKGKGKEIDSSDSSSDSEQESKKRNQKGRDHQKDTTVGSSSAPAGTVETV